MAESAFNLYELIDLDPTIVDAEPVKRQLDLKLEWAKTVSGTARKEDQTLSNKLKERARELQEIVADEARRMEHARVCLGLVKEKYRLATDQIETLARNGSYSDAHIKAIATQFKLPEDAIKDLIRKAGLKSAPAASKVAPLPPRTLSTIADGIDNALREAGLETLYEYLGRDNGIHYNRNSSRKNIEARYREIEATVKKMSSGTSASNLGRALLGHVNAHLLDDAKRVEYDNYCDIRPLERYIRPLVELIGRDSKSLSNDDVVHIVRKAQQEKTVSASAATAESYIHDLLAQKKWVLRRSASDAPIDVLPRCGFCDRGSPVGSQRCVHCGKPMFTDCPACHHRQVPTSMKCCPVGTCGFPIGDLPAIEKQMRQVQVEICAGNLVEARKVCQAVRGIWPDYAPANQVLADIDQREKRIEETRQARLSKISELGKLADARRFVEASRLLRDLDVVSTGDIPPDVRQKIRGRLAEAEQKLRLGRQAAAGGDVATAVKHVESALDLCADFDEAQAELRRFPPPVPTELKVQVGNTCIRLTWRVVDSERNLSYVVCRKERGAPISENDGVKLGTTAAGLFDDAGADVGKVWFYAVFSLRAGVSFSRPVTCGPLLRVGKPVIVRAVASRQAAHIEFTPPYGCDRVDVVRTPPGDRITRIGNAITDAGLSNGRRYTYQLRAMYRNPSGGAMISGDPEDVVLTPEEAPDAVKDLRLTPSGPVVLINWENVRAGRVMLRELDREPTDLVPGIEIDVARVGTIGKAITNQSTSSAQVNVPKAGRLVVVPFTVSGSTAVVGVWQQISSLPEVTALEARMGNIGKVEVRWNWPEGVDRTIVTLYADDRGAERMRSAPVTKSSYQQWGQCAEIEYGSKPPKLIRVQCVSACETFQSSGATTILRLSGRGSVRYRIENGAAGEVIKGFMFGTIGRFRDAIQSRVNGENPGRVVASPNPRFPALVVESDVCERVCDFVVVGLANRLPLDIGDGETIYTAGEVQLVKGRADVPLDGVAIKRDMYVRVFLRRPELQPQVQLQPAPKDQLLLKAR